MAFNDADWVGSAASPVTREDELKTDFRIRPHLSEGAGRAGQPGARVRTGFQNRGVIRRVRRGRRDGGTRAEK